MLLPTLLTATAPLFAGSNLAWFDGTLEAAVTEAQAADGMVVLYCWRSESDYCAKLYQETLLTDTAAEALEGNLLLSASWDDPVGAELVRRFGVQTLPSLVFLDGEGTAQDAIAGFLSADELAVEVARIARGEGTLADLERRAAAKHEQLEEALEAQFLLAGKCQELGAAERHDQVMAAIRERDPKGTTVVGSRALLWNLQSELYAAAREQAGFPDGPDGDPDKAAAISAALDVAPLYKHAKRVKPDEARFEAWNAVANAEAGAKRTVKACKALASAAKYVADDRAPDFLSGSAKWILEMDGERTKKEARQALSFAEKAHAHFLENYTEAERSKEYEAYVLSVLARAHEANGARDEATRILQRCVELQPEGDYGAMLESMRESA